MCLRQLDKAKTLELKKKAKPIVCWKVVRKDFSPVYYNYQGINYKIGKVFKSSRPLSRLTIDESVSNTVRLGCHCFTTRRDARSLKRCLANYCEIKIIKVVGHPKNLVSVGTDDIDYPCMVFTKVRVIKVVY